MRGVARPIVGFFGLIESWIDLPLLEHVAVRRPGWSIVLVGKAAADVSALRRHPNVHLLGRRPYAELPRYAKAFDVAVCPFVAGELSRNVNPIKLREYLSAGVPVVASGIPEAASHGDACRLARTPDEFLAACERAMRDDSAEARRRRSEAMRGETWASKAEESLRIALRVQADRRGVAA
jgi:glycosyltransferase involved in cell wall biosynthesis